jgi:hypothetical protein
MHRSQIRKNEFHVKNAIGGRTVHEKLLAAVPKISLGKRNPNVKYEETGKKENKEENGTLGCSVNEERRGRSEGRKILD